MQRAREGLWNGNIPYGYCPEALDIHQRIIWLQGFELRQSMEQITIQVKNKQKAQAVINFLKAMDLFEDIIASDLFTLKLKAKINKKEIFALAGLGLGGT